MGNMINNIQQQKKKYILPFMAICLNYVSDMFKPWEENVEGELDWQPSSEPCRSNGGFAEGSSKFENV